MSNEPFWEAVVDVVLFLELSDAGTVNEDAAVALLEQLAATLQRLGRADVALFLDYVNLRAMHSKTPREREALLGLGTNLGLRPE